MNSYSRIRRGRMAADSFTQIRNALFRDPRVSYKAKGIFGYISTHRDGYGVSAESIAKAGPGGISAVRSGLQELERYGYLYMLRHRNADGTLGSAEYFITDEPGSIDMTDLPEGVELMPRRGRSQPESENRNVVDDDEIPRSGPDCDFPDVDDPDVDEPHVDNRPTKNTSTKKTRETKKTVHPSVGSKGAPDTAQTKEGTDGQTVPTQSRKQLQTIERTPGVALLQGLGYERPEMMLAGKVLADQARTVDGLLLSGWQRDQVLAELLKPLPKDVRSVGAVVSHRLGQLCCSPVPRPVELPTPRSPESASGYWDNNYEAGKSWAPDAWSANVDTDAFLRRGTSRWLDCVDCRNPVITPTGTDRCVQCEGWPCCQVCRRPVAPGTRCERCDLVPGEVEFEWCAEHGDQFVAGTACFHCTAP